VQSERFFLPEIYSPVELKFAKTFIANNITDNAAFSFLYTGDAKSFVDVICDGPVSFFIGPEGDFDSSEVIFFEESGILPYSLGKNILKVETAVIAALSILAAKSV
jgi:RsmE family RNA methyltransferase